MTDKKLIILGKGPVAGLPYNRIRHKCDIPGYDGHTVWTVGTHHIDDADGYICLHGENRDRELPLLEDAQAYGNLGILINNSISVMLLLACMQYDDFTEVRIAGCPLLVGSEYTEQRESLFMVMGYLRAIRNVKITWDHDVPYNNYYSTYLGVRYE